MKYAQEKEMSIDTFCSHRNEMALLARNLLSRTKKVSFKNNTNKKKWYMYTIHTYILI